MLLASELFSTLSDAGWMGERFMYVCQDEVYDGVSRRDRHDWIAEGIMEDVSF